jgi:hypothetical protein
MITPRPADEVPELLVIPYDPDLSARRYAALMGRAVLDEMIAPLDAVDGIARFAACGRDEAAVRLDAEVSALYEADVEAARRLSPLRVPVVLTAWTGRIRRTREQHRRPWSRWIASFAR